MLKTTKAKLLLKALEALGYEPFNLSDRNKKLVPNATTAYAIWNLPAQETCPFATPDCIKFCYAKKAEKAYPTCLPSRERNYGASLRDDFVFRMTLTLLKRRKGCRKARLIVRIHESGDFYNADYVGKWLRVMENCKGEDIVFIAYTKSFPFFDGVELPENFSLRASLDGSSSSIARDMVEANDWNRYEVVPKFAKDYKGAKCRCEDCASCNMCISLKIKSIQCEIH